MLSLLTNHLLNLIGVNHSINIFIFRHFKWTRLKQFYTKLLHQCRCSLWHTYSLSEQLLLLKGRLLLLWLSIIHYHHRRISYYSILFTGVTWTLICHVIQINDLCPLLLFLLSLQHHQLGQIQSVHHWLSPLTLWSPARVTTLPIIHLGRVTGSSLFLFWWQQQRLILNGTLFLSADLRLIHDIGCLICGNMLRPPKLLQFRGSLHFVLHQRLYCELGPWCRPASWTRFSLWQFVSSCCGDTALSEWRFCCSDRLHTIVSKLIQLKYLAWD